MNVEHMTLLQLCWGCATKSKPDACFLLRWFFLCCVTFVHRVSIACCCVDGLTQCPIFSCVDATLIITIPIND